MSENNNTLENTSKSDQIDKNNNSYFEKVLNDKNKFNISYEDYDTQKGEISPRFLFRKRKVEYLELNYRNYGNQSFGNSSIQQNVNTLQPREKDNLSNSFTPIGSKETKEQACNFYMNNYSNISQNSNNSHNSGLLNSIPTEEEKIISKINFTFDNYLDFVHDTYFSLNEKEHKSSELNFADSATGLICHNFMNNNIFKFSSLDLLVNPLREKLVWETWSPYEVALFECCICKFNRNFDMYEKIVSSQ